MTDNPRPETICIVGLGTVGREMAINLMKAGYRVQAFDVRHEAVDDLATLGAQVRRSVAAALPATALVTSPYIEAHAHDEGRNGNQALFRVYDRMTNQVRDTPA
jgi:3-hydroxyisobutyrate dehydrogenase-like beta-hydroxyacid dehydrogenase